MFTILYFLVRIILYVPGEGDDFLDMMGNLIVDPITFVFAGLMLAAVIATRIKKKEMKNGYLTGIVTAVTIGIPFFIVIQIYAGLELPDEKILPMIIVCLGIAICIFSLTFILLSLHNGRGVVDGLIDMFDFEMQGIFWVVLVFGSIMILLLPIVLAIMVGGGGGSRSSSSDDDDETFMKYLFIKVHQDED